MQLSLLAGRALSPSQGRVLRNTYALLALSLLPTMAGAWLGLTTGLLQGLGPVLSFVVFMAGGFGLMYAVQRNKHSAAGVPWLFAFTFFMGLMLSQLLAVILSRGNGAHLVLTAFGATAIVFFGMAALSSVIKRDLSSLGSVLFVGATLVVAAAVLNIFLQSSALMLTLSVFAAGVFSLFVLHDLKQVRDGYETNYISATLEVYLSLYNVFTSVLQLLGIVGSTD